MGPAVVCDCDLRRVFFNHGMLQGCCASVNKLVRLFGSWACRGLKKRAWVGRKQSTHRTYLWRGALLSLRQTTRWEPRRELRSPLPERQNRSRRSRRGQRLPWPTSVSLRSPLPRVPCRRPWRARGGATRDVEGMGATQCTFYLAVGIAEACRVNARVPWLPNSARIVFSCG